MTVPAGGAARFDLDAFLRELDAIFAGRRGPDAAERHLRAALAHAEGLGDLGARLTILNEMMGFWRSVSRHDEAVSAARDALALADALGLAGSEAYATTLINAATALRAAGLHDEAKGVYRDALEASRATMGATDRRLAALHNNLSILHSETGALDEAAAELEAALAILEATSVDPGGDLDVATTLTNLALVEYSRGEQDRAGEHAARSIEICRRGGHERDPHFAAALAGQAEASFRMGRPADAAALYEDALGIIAECYGEDTDAYRVTAENLAQAREAAGGTDARPTAAPAPDPAAPAPDSAAARAASAPSRPAASSPVTPARPDPVKPFDQAALPDISGLELARRYWEEHGRPMLEERYPEYRGRIAAGLVGHGSDCYGFDDAASRDHDFGPGFCLWLTAADHAQIGDRLQADYEALPREFLGFPARLETTRARGEGRRVGVFEVGEFFTSLTGRPQAPTTAHEWLLLDEATLAAATNGRVFADPLGAFGKARGGFQRMPQDVRLALVSRRLGMVAQAGQYNVPRMLDRGDGAAAWLAVGEFAQASASLVFLLNGPTSVGYLPYYKWHFAALRALAARPASRLPGVVGGLEDALRLASAACFGGAGFGEGGKGAGPARAGLEAAIAGVCAAFVEELRVQGLTESDSDFLEHHRPQLAARISDPWLAAQ
ncbi:DUF4037 domain-containing protein [Demequina pelophila]|uniref:DUF4037 domain-containing protein n=1 Tax=Demequina pelophila TaxID=1638984 RepID=UPI000782F5C7|nr:DUF4037 domain-containing protein [Demequina pelophila]